MGVNSSQSLMENENEQFGQYIKDYIWAYFKCISSEIQHLKEMQ